MRIAHHKRLPKKRVIYFSACFLTFCVIAILIFFNYSRVISFARDDIIVRSHVKSLGVGAINREVNIYDLTTAVTKNIFSLFYKKTQAQISVNPIVLDLKFKQIDILAKSRSIAIEEGMLLRHYPTVKGKLRSNDEIYDVKVGLKGYFLDHLATKKWSLKMRFPENAFEGMVDISIQAPFTRDFQTAPVISYAMRHKRILTPRDGYFDMTINGQKLGLMYYEERLGEPFTEKNGVPYGPIFKYDEKANRLKLTNKKFFWANDLSSSFIGERIESLLLEPDKFIHLINKKKWAEYFAVTFLFKCFHGNLDMNLIYYMHPLNKKIEPISNDHSCGQKDKARNLGFLPLPGEIAHKFLKNGKIAQLVINELEWWQNSQQAEKLIKKLNKHSEDIKKLLINEAPFLGEFKISLDHVEQLKEWLVRLDSEEDELMIDKPSKNDLSLQKYNEPLLIVERSGGILSGKIRRFNKDKYKMFEIEYKDKEQKIKMPINNSFTNKELSDFINSTYLGYELSGNPKILLHYKLKEASQRTFSRPMSIGFSSDASYLIKPNLIHEIRHYFKYDEATNTFYLEENKTINLPETLRLPKGYNLRLSKGSEIFFSNKVGLIVNGSLFVDGELGSEVLLYGSTSDWGGLLVNSYGKKSIIKYLNVFGGTGVFDGIPIRGSVTFNNGTVHIEHSKFKRNQAEDALNLNQVFATLNFIQISNTKSDGLDADFSNVSISNVEFLNIGRQSGADAIDISRTTLDAKDLKIQNVTDKGISVGEASKGLLDNVKINNTMVGIVVKDSSEVATKNIDLSSVGLVDYMAYNKKQHYGAAKLKITEDNKNAARIIAEHGSIVYLNEELVPTRDVNVEKMYNSFMKSVK